MKRNAPSALDTGLTPIAEPAPSISEDQAVEPIHWTEASKQLANLRVDGCDLLSNKFGWMLKRSLKGKKFVIQGPPCTVVWAPAYLDQSKFGNSTPDPKRKKDKWSMTLKTTSQKFADFYNKDLKKVTLRHMFEQRTAWGGDSYEDPMQLMALLPNPIAIDADSQSLQLRCDLTASKDASKPELLLRDYETEKLLSDEIVLGQHSVVVPIIDLSDVFIGKASKCKQYSKVPVVYVKELVSDTRVDPAAYKRVKRDGEDE